MRPRVFPAEDGIVGRSSPGPRGRMGFNEAAGIPRGRHIRKPTVLTVRGGVRFNEAAGIPRGRPALRAQPAS